MPVWYLNSYPWQKLNHSLLTLVFLESAPRKALALDDGGGSDGHPRERYGISRLLRYDARMGVSPLGCGIMNCRE